MVHSKFPDFSRHLKLDQGNVQQTFSTMFLEMWLYLCSIVQILHAKTTYSRVELLNWYDIVVD